MPNYQDAEYIAVCLRNGQDIDRNRIIASLELVANDAKTLAVQVARLQQQLADVTWQLAEAQRRR